jgi:small subunit ribosomal protein S17
MRTKKGIVTSAKMSKTVVVTVYTYRMHSKYGKRFRLSKKFFAHDPNDSHKEGDTVVIKETIPLSKKKCWIVVEEDSLFSQKA